MPRNAVVGFGRWVSDHADGARLMGATLAVAAVAILGLTLPGVILAAAVAVLTWWSTSRGSAPDTEAG